MKEYISGLGFPMDEDFSSHQLQCHKCKSGELAKLCLEGSILWKLENTKIERRNPIMRSQYYATAKEVKKLMRYK